MPTLCYSVLLTCLNTDDHTPPCQLGLVFKRSACSLICKQPLSAGQVPNPQSPCTEKSWAGADQTGLWLKMPAAQARCAVFPLSKAERKKRCDPAAMNTHQPIWMQWDIKAEEQQKGVMLAGQVGPRESERGGLHSQHPHAQKFSNNDALPFKSSSLISTHVPGHA